MSSNRYQLFAAGSYNGRIGACAWCGVDEWGNQVEGCFGFQSGPTRSEGRMYMRAAFEGLLRMPEGSSVTVYWGWGSYAQGNADLSRAIEEVKADRKLDVDFQPMSTRRPDDLPVYASEMLYVTEDIAKNAVAKR